MPRPTPDYFYQRRLDGLYAIYDAGERVLGYEHIPTWGEAKSHIRDLIEADRVRAQEEAAALADFEAQRLGEAA